MPRKHPLAAWFQRHTTEQGAQLCKLAKTSRPYLRHVIAGRRALSLEMKMELEIAAAKIDRKIDTLDLGGGVAVNKYMNRMLAAPDA